MADTPDSPSVPSWQPAENTPLARVIGRLDENGRRRRGAPTALTQEVGELVLDGLKQGLTVTAAAKYAGIHRDTFYGWLERAKVDPDSGYGLFSDAVEKTEADLIYRHLSMINGGADKWQASAWVLERKWPEDYGLKKDQAPPTLFQYVTSKDQPTPDEDIPPEIVAEDP